ncbi:MAG: efflux RND transporter permease subunit, partial [Arcobacteraceae bacterium]
MEKVIRYFIEHYRLNHTILVFIIFMGIFSYFQIPKELFPNVKLDTILVKGEYQGASSDSLNNFAVTEIENQLKTVSDIKCITSTVKNGSFDIELELQDGVNKYETLNEVKDAISIAKQ